MKKKLLAIMIPACLFTVNADAAKIYEDGSFVNLYTRLGFNITDKADEHAEGKFDGRLGFSGKQVINDQFSLIGQAQFQVGAMEMANKGSNSFSPRYVWTGFDANEYGKATFGRVASGLIMFTDIGDVFASSDVAVGRQVSKVDTTATQVFRQDGTLQYQNSIANFDFSAAYILGNSESNLKSSYNTALRYTFDFGNAGQFAPVVVYQHNQSRDNLDNVNNIDSYDLWGAGFRYYIGDVMLGALYSEDNLTYLNSSTESKDTDIEMTLVYNFAEDWNFKTGYRNLKNEGGDEVEVDTKTFEFQYKVTNKSSIFAAYMLQDGDDGTTEKGSFSRSNEESFYHIGLRYEW
ncbi:porin [Psychromonas sp. Urea-02u-13]|uniref:porin n=1 Tax=Psychromonas sp. Urea-02u-13 TaxID=2058326 RepID=UPI000C329CD9|nr:porin [Psychromonas sp. Urea-02u-13]PKG39776.1 porin [Psychromonas sp. Urea-02u-13]